MKFVDGSNFLFLSICFLEVFLVGELFEIWCRMVVCGGFVLGFVCGGEFFIWFFKSNLLLLVLKSDFMFFIWIKIELYLFVFEIKKSN